MSSKRNTVENHWESLENSHTGFGGITYLTIWIGYNSLNIIVSEIWTSAKYTHALTSKPALAANRSKFISTINQSESDWLYLYHRKLEHSNTLVALGYLDILGRRTLSSARYRNYHPLSLTVKFRFYWLAVLTVVILSARAYFIFIWSQTQWHSLGYLK